MSKKEETKQLTKRNKRSFSLQKKRILVFEILAIFAIIAFAIAYTPKSFQNDTFYTIKLGQQLRKTGIDYKDHYSIHENLQYMYPHWLYDISVSLIYDFCGKEAGLYIGLMGLYIILGMLLYYENKKLTKKRTVGIAITLIQMVLIEPFMAVRAQSVTFILFVLEIIFIEKFLEKPKKSNVFMLLLIPTIIANVHSAVFPMYFVLMLPYIGEYLIVQFLDLHLWHKIKNKYYNTRIKMTNSKLKKLENTSKKDINKYKDLLIKYNKKLEENNKNFEKYLIKIKENRKKPYKIRLKKEKNVKFLLIIFAVALFTGLLTPIKDMPYMYVYRTFKGETTKFIQEHLPLMLIKNKEILITITLTLGVLIFTKVKIRLKDLFFIGGLLLATFISKRQWSLYIVIGMMSAGVVLSELLDIIDSRAETKIITFLNWTLPAIVTAFIITFVFFKGLAGKKYEKYIPSSVYPVESTQWIKDNLDYKNKRIYNSYNYGSYMLMNDVPVFIDSRCDLYTPEFNGKYDKKEKKYKGRNIFGDYNKVSKVKETYLDTLDEYKIDYLLVKKDSLLYRFINKQNKDRFEELYKDDYFVVYKYNNPSKDDGENKEIEENKEQEKEDKKKTEEAENKVKEEALNDFLKANNNLAYN